MKNIIIAALVGISFLTSGFWVGLRFAPMPKKPAPASVAVAKPEPSKAEREGIALAALKAASENMVGVNEALKSREAAVAEREKKVQQQEEEIVAERAALDRLHVHFKELYGQFQQRLQLVSDNEQAELARQVEVFDSMDPAQVADMMRSLDDGTIMRMFTIMESKPLSKLVAAWKTKYPSDSTRLLTDLNGMGRVVAENKIILPASPSPTDSPSPATDGSAPASPTPDASAQPATPTDNSAPAADPNTSAATTPTAADTSSSSPAAAPADPNAAASSSSDASAPASQAADASAPASPSTPPAPAAGPAPTDAPAAPATSSDGSSAPPPTDSTPAAPSAPAPGSTAPSSASLDGESTAPLDTPGETAAKSTAISRNTPGSDPAPEPSDFATPAPATRPDHDKAARFASARNYD